jgi:hypothetical protein
VSDYTTSPKHQIIQSEDAINKEISLWEARILEKEKSLSSLSMAIRDITSTLTVFGEEYYSKVGILYVRLDQVRLSIKRYQYRIELAKEEVSSETDLEDIEKEVREAFEEEERKVDDMENEASEYADGYRQYLEEERKIPLDSETWDEIRTIFRKLALRTHPDLAKNEAEREAFHNIFVIVNEAYENSDVDTLREYLKQALEEERIAKESPQEKLARLKDHYRNILRGEARSRTELEDLKACDTYKLYERCSQAKKDGKDLLEELAASVNSQITENQTLLNDLVAEYKNIVGGLV